jgi:hypothetical protein
MRDQESTDLGAAYLTREADPDPGYDDRPSPAELAEDDMPWCEDELDALRRVTTGPPE